MKNCLLNQSLSGRLVVISALLMISCNCLAQLNESARIKEVLNRQVAAWNKGNIDDFMYGYWQSDSLSFIGKSGASYGYTNTLKRYKKSYPDTAAMGKLQFSGLQFMRLSDEYYYVIGNWHLQRTMGDIGGMFTLLFRKINERWQIISDHSS